MSQMGRDLLRIFQVPVYILCDSPGGKTPRPPTPVSAQRLPSTFKLIAGEGGEEGGEQNPPNLCGNLFKLIREAQEGVGRFELPMW